MSLLEKNALNISHWRVPGGRSLGGRIYGSTILQSTTCDAATRNLGRLALPALQETNDMFQASYDSYWSHFHVFRILWSTDVRGLIELRGNEQRRSNVDQCGICGIRRGVGVVYRRYVVSLLDWPLAM